jgi:hypothetical protein
MSLNLVFWVIMLLWLVFGFMTAPRPINGVWIGGNLLIFVLLAILGWQVFGSAIHR